MKQSMSVYFLLLLLFSFGFVEVMGTTVSRCGDCTTSDTCCTDRLVLWCCASGSTCDSASRGCIVRSEQVTDLQQSFTMVYFTWSFVIKMTLCLLACATCAFVVSFSYIRVRYAMAQLLQRLERDQTTVESSDEAVSEGEGEDEELITTSNTPASQGHCAKCGNAIDCVLLRCSHAVVCFSCARRLRECPTCDTKIHRRQRLFYA